VLLNKPVPVDTVFIGGIDNRGYLITVDEMERRVKRAKALGYKHIIGPKVIGSQTLIWEETENLEGIREMLFQ
jgi:predicted ATP-dependent serine protease